MINCKNCMAFSIFYSTGKWVSWSTWPSHHRRHHRHQQQRTEIQWKIFTNNQPIKVLEMIQRSQHTAQKPHTEKAENDLCWNDDGNDYDIVILTTEQNYHCRPLAITFVVHFFCKSLSRWQKKQPDFEFQITNASVYNDIALKLRARLTIDSFVWSTFRWAEHNDDDDGDDDDDDYNSEKALFTARIIQPVLKLWVINTFLEVFLWNEKALWKCMVNNGWKKIIENQRLYSTELPDIKCSRTRWLFEQSEKNIRRAILRKI